MSADKPVVITVTIQPMKGSKRPIVVAGAVEGRMPIFRTGVFADLHTLVDDVYIEANARRAAPAKPAGKAKKVALARKAKPKADQLDRVEEAAEEIDETADEPAEIDETAGETEDEALPVIEGDEPDEGQLNLLEDNNG